MLRAEGHVLAVQKDFPGVCQEAAGDGVEQGRFARAVGADDGDEVAGADVEGEIIQRRLSVRRAGVKGLSQMGKLQHWAPSSPVPARRAAKRRRSMGSRVLKYGSEMAAMTMTEETSLSIKAGISNRRAMA